MKSKKRSRITIGKPLLDEPPVFFLDRTFGKTKLVEMLRPAGFTIVTHHEEYGDEGHNIGDPAIIHDCGLKKRILLTGDKDLVHTYAREIRSAKIAVFVTTDNMEGPQKWGPRIISARSDILRELKRRERPFTAVISAQGRVSQVRVYEHGQWKVITIGKKNPPHVNRQKQTYAIAVEVQEGSTAVIENHTGKVAGQDESESKGPKTEESR